MATQPLSARKRDKVKALFRRRTPQPPESSNDVVTTPAHATLPIQPQSSSNNVAPTAPNSSDIPSAAGPPQKPFVRGKLFEKDIAILSTTYILEGDPELKNLIHLIVVIHDLDEDDQLTGVLETCALFSIQLASATEAHRVEATQAIMEFIKTIEKVKTVQREGGVQFLDALAIIVHDDIAKIKSSHPAFARDNDPGTSTGLSEVFSVTIGASITVLETVKEASSLVPLPWIQPLIGGIVTLLKAVERTRTNYADMRQIAATAGEFVVSCAVIHSNHSMEPSRDFKRALNKFTKTLEIIAKECADMSRLNAFWRYLQQSAHTGDLQAIRARLNSAIELFQTQSHVIMQLDIKVLSQKIDYSALNTLPNHPHYVRNDYLSGSRDDVLEYVSGWIDQPSDFVLWIHGAAGLGKSTVGQQLVHLLKDDNRLAGGIFLTNLTTEHPEVVIQMISRQLGEMHPRAIPNIADAARRLNGPHSLLRDYFTAYIINPLCELNYPYQLVVVIDALEEWRNHESFLAELAHLPPSPPLKFVLTSRPRHSIERLLDKISVRPYPLPPVSQEIVEIYFNHRFEVMNWRGRKPGQQTVNRLAIRAEGLLIWAATVCSLLSHEYDNRYPHEILDQILLSEEKVATRSGEQLERLYRDAILSLFPTPNMRRMLRDFLGAMMVVQEALPIRDFAGLLGMSDRPAEEIQRQLAALQTRGHFKSDVVSPASQRFHVSFLEFIELTTTEYDGQSIAISSIDSHSTLANRCLESVFFKLLQSPRGQTCVYSELRDVERYAVKFWPLHLSNGTSRLLLAPFAARALVDTPEEDLRRWATWFLASVTTRLPDDAYSALDNAPRSVLFKELAWIIGEEDDVTTLSNQLYCLEVAVRVQRIDVGTWIPLGIIYDRLYKKGRYNKDLDEEISVFRHALGLVSQTAGAHGDEGLTNTSTTNERAHILASLASAIHVRFEQRGAMIDLDEEISLHREALILLPAPHPARSISLNNLANSLQTRFEQRGFSNDLDEAISLHSEVLDLRPPPHPDRSTSLNNLANVLQTRFEQRGAPNDLDEAIFLNREALDLRPPSHPDRSMSLNNLASALKTRFEQRGASNDLDEAILLLQEALVLRPAPHPNRPSSLSELAISLRTRFRLQKGASNDLDESISLLREVLDLRPPPHPARSMSLNNLANSLQTRFEQRRTSNDIGEAISLHREALALLPPTHLGRAMSLNNLASALQMCFLQQGDSNNLDEAISLHREALGLRPAPHPDRTSSLYNLASALQMRFQQQGASNNLDEAISLHREALVHLSESHPWYSELLKLLTISLYSRYKTSDTAEDLDAVILLHRKILSFSAQDRNRSWALERFPSALRERYALTGDQSDIDEAINVESMA